MAWFDTVGKDSDVVLASRLTVTRNIENYPFDLAESIPAIPFERRNMLLEDICELLSSEGYSSVGLSSLDYSAIKALEKKQFLDHGFSDESKSEKGTNGILMLDEANSRSAMLFGHDQIRLRILAPGSSLDEAYEMIYAIERHLDRNFDLAYSKEYGYLTSDPKRLGTAAEFSLMLHLPAMKSLETHLFGIEVKKHIGDIFFLTALPFPGISEAEQLERLSFAAEKIIVSERAARTVLRHDSTKLCDRVMRAFGILSNAYIMSEDELFALWSDIRLGSIMGLCELQSPEELGSILISALICPTENEIPDEARAALIKQRLRIHELNA